MEDKKGSGSGSGSKPATDECQEQKPRPGPSRSTRSRINLSRRALTHSRSMEDLRGQFRNVSNLQGRPSTTFHNVSS
ncbi:unnamed protein product, partial [Callosobruchus maculatus]